MAITTDIMTTKHANVERFRAALLRWYDAHRRTLPWRATPETKPDPYHVWLSEIMLQQTTVPAVIPYFQKFLKKWPTVHDLAAAENEEIMQNWAGLGYYARARNLHKCVKVVSEEFGGQFPSGYEDLKKLPGIGDYTAAAIRAIAFNKPANVVDGNVERVMARLFAVTDPVPDAKPHLKSLAATMASGEAKRPGDYAQALMDLGATVCTPSSPKCGVCPVRGFCSGREQGIANTLPARKVKGAKPQKHGYVYWIEDGKGQILVEKRPEHGLLGGMVGLPTSIWVDKAMEKTHLPFILKPKKGKERILHSFTHFDLDLQGVRVSLDGAGATLADGNYFWTEKKAAENLGFPTVFKKALKQFG